MTTNTTVSTIDLQPGDQILYGGNIVRIKDMWRWDDNVGLKLHEHIGYVVLSKHDTVHVVKR